MMTMRIVLLLISSISVNTHYSLYHSDISQTSYPTFDCLYAHLIDAGREIGSRYIRNYHLIPYCRRPDIDEKQEQIKYVMNENIVQIITFAELKKQGITSQQLLEWFAPIDIAERYEMNNGSSDIFYNCSLPWFGSMCQYQLGYDSSLSFGNIVETNFANYSTASANITIGTCYPFLDGCNHTSWPLCLDWREICDGKSDCINGEDEKWCDQLEMTKCTNDEYRCHYGGQCIPLTFAKDSRLSIDCLDGSDEQDNLMYFVSLLNTHCTNVQTFRCQERIGRYPRSFQCGDGQYLLRFGLPSRTPACLNKRDIEFSRAILTSLNHILDVDCRQAFYCALYCNRTQEMDQQMPPDRVPPVSIVDDVWDEDCEPLSQHCSAEWLFIPEYPMMFGFFQFVYLTNRSVSEFKKSATPDFICFDAQKCPALLATIVTIELVNGLACCNTSNLIDDIEYVNFDQLLLYFVTFSWKCSTTSVEKSCPNSSYFYCNQSSKCISYYRVGDGVDDCSYFEDEIFDACQLNDSNRFICESNPKNCLLPVAIGDGFSNCPSDEDEIYIYTRDLVKLVPFSVLCDHVHDFEVHSFNTTETDETNCEWWPCNNSYTHCDGIWHCSNGADELNCPNTQCSPNEHECEDQWRTTFYCLPLAHIFDKYLDDCSGSYLYRQLYFYNGTRDISKNYFSWNNSKCITSEDICRTSYGLQTSTSQKKICSYPTIGQSWVGMLEVHLLENSESLCYFNFRQSITIAVDRFLTATRFGNFPPITINYSLPIIPKYNQNSKVISKINISLLSYCHRGIAVLTGVNGIKTCLCPPNYFGTRCQWQNQRVSLTLQLFWRNTASTTIIFQVIIMLINENGEIASNSEQIIYIPSRDCDTKFNIYLLYPNRPKNLSHKYSIRIDLFEKTKLDYWASWYIAIPFPFLPVNRISTQLFIPEIRETKPCSLSCGEHGKCMHYVKTKSLFFCQCNQGYSGVHCEIQHQCNCSNDSLCLTPSICICPLYKFGSHCYLKHSTCQSLPNPCQHNGLCVPNDDRIDSTGFTCFCTEDYSGTRCENTNNRIDINFDDDEIMEKNSLVLIHFITAFKHVEHQRITLLKKIPFNQHIITLYVSQPFNILFLQISNQSYYLAILREIFIPSEYISTQIESYQRCLSINKLNSSLLDYEYLRRTKYYPLLCRQYLQLMCFYDNDLMCICDLDRFSNCFLFNHTMNYDCYGHNTCENDGQCFQNNQTCPTKSTCVCPDCYYGSKCQFSTKGFLFSLDSILAYHIKPNISINQQPLIIKISIAISTIMLISGLISSILSIITFCRKNSREVGSGNYLFISSITSTCMIIILTVKFWHLILSQMSLITNRSWLIFNCKSVDFILKILLASSEWLNACVAFERMISVSKGTSFNKTKSKKYSKWVIPSIFLLTIITQIHDPIYRQLIDDSDADEKRIWCFVQYSHSVRSYNIFITLFHFLVPFSIHLITALRIIKKIALRRAIIQPEQSYQVHLKQQLHRHQNLLFAPCMLILLSLPRLVISFMKGCMRSARKPLFYLIGYFVSFIPSILTFVVFVLPSKHYKKEFNNAYEQTLRRFRARL